MHLARRLALFQRDAAGDRGGLGLQSIPVGEDAVQFNSISTEFSTEFCWYSGTHLSVHVLAKVR